MPLRKHIETLSPLEEGNNGGHNTNNNNSDQNSAHSNSHHTNSHSLSHSNSASHSIHEPAATAGDMASRLLAPLQQSLLHPPGSGNTSSSTSVHIRGNSNHSLHAVDVLPAISMLPMGNGNPVASLTSPPVTARGNVFISPPPELSAEPFIIYDNVQMVSELETKLVIIYYPAVYTLEIACIVLGVQEGDCLHLYLDYRSLFSAILQPDMVSKFKKRRRNVVVEFLVGRLSILRDMNKWTLTLDNPKHDRDRIYFTENSNADSKGVLLSDTTDSLVEVDEIQEFKKQKMLDEKVRLDLQKLICDKPIEITTFDINNHLRGKSDGNSTGITDHPFDLPLLPQSMLRTAKVTNMLGKVWLGMKDPEGDLIPAAVVVDPPTGEGHTFAKTNILMEYLDNKHRTATPPRTAASSIVGSNHAIQVSSVPSTAGLPKIDSKQANGHHHSAATTVVSFHGHGLTSPKSHYQEDINKRHVYDALAGNDSALPPIKNVPSHEDRGKYKLFSGMFFHKSTDSTSETVTNSTSGAPSFDANMDLGESTSSKSSKMRRKTLTSTPIEKPKTAIKYSFGTNSLAALTIDEQNTSPSNLPTNDTGRNHRRTFGMDPLHSHFTTPGGSALAAAALTNPFKWRNRQGSAKKSETPAAAAAAAVAIAPQ